MSSGFNSIKVRLKVDEETVIELSKWFQFHKGAIKSLTIERLNRAYYLFQFHKGAIKSTA